MAVTTTSQALEYHANPKPGKLEIKLTKATETAEDLALAYSPGVAAPVLEISKNHEEAYKYTNKGNLVAVITNGTAILGLGNLGALASKPVMEGKAALFKKFADVDVFDIEVDTTNIDEFINTVVNISPTFGGINLEDIKAPDCFEIEEKLKQKIAIPVFHDDQHGTAVAIAAGLINALKIQNKQLSNCIITCIGAGAAGIASMEFLVKLGAVRENIRLVDSKGLINSRRTNLGKYKERFAQHTPQNTQQDAIAGSDVLIGLAGADIVTPAELASMNQQPIIFTLSNPSPEISYDLARKTRPDAVIATGRSDLPNQINNVLCFPYLFKAALSVRATQITHEMLAAAANAIAEMAQTDQEKFGMDYIIPSPLDTRLRQHVTQAIIKAYNKRA